MFPGDYGCFCCVMQVTRDVGQSQQLQASPSPNAAQKSGLTSTVPPPTALIPLQPSSRTPVRQSQKWLSRGPRVPTGLFPLFLLPLCFARLSKFVSAPGKSCLQSATFPHLIHHSILCLFAVCSKGLAVLEQCRNSSQRTGVQEVGSDGSRLILASVFQLQDGCSPFAFCHDWKLPEASPEAETTILPVQPAEPLIVISGECDGSAANFILASLEERIQLRGIRHSERSSIGSCGGFHSQVSSPEQLEKIPCRDRCGYNRMRARERRADEV
nr:uncharacterized protein LOC129478477 [Symphalangus syndactylus]